MEHLKIYHSLTIQTTGAQPEIVVEGPVTPEHLQTLEMHKDLDSFRRPNDQLEALIEISGLPEGRIIISRSGNTIVGYVTFHYPDPIERWSQGNMVDLIELGAIEMADDYRGLGLGKKMIQLAFMKDQLEDVITFTTEYYWHWDLEKTGLNVWDYRKMMEKLMKSVDMVWYATDDPEICSHPANCLMVRVGKRVPLSSVEQFDQIRFQRRFMY
jgi:acetoin utilization protein AcuA